MRIRNYIFGKMREVCRSFGYQEYDGPMLEPFDLYAAKTGEEIVNQQLYWLMDRGERKMAIRPEMTPTMARMVAGKIHELPKPVRWFSIPNLWRYERPQRGRLREHWQLNVDVLGGDLLLADAELLSLAFSLMKAFGGEDRVSIRVNNRRLMDQLFQEKLGLDAKTALAVTKIIDMKAKIDEAKYSAMLSEVGVSSSQISMMESFFRSDLEAAAKLLPGAGADERGAVCIEIPCAAIGTGGGAGGAGGGGPGWV
jgi:histidyl-tRNA synthetase